MYDLQESVIVPLHNILVPRSRAANEEDIQQRFLSCQLYFKVYQNYLFFSELPSNYFKTHIHSLGQRLRTGSTRLKGVCTLLFLPNPFDAALIYKYRACPLHLQLTFLFINTQFKQRGHIGSTTLAGAVSRPIK